MLERLTIRVSEDMNNWLEERSEKTGLSKSALVSVALDNYRKEQDTLKMLPEIMRKLDSLKGVDIEKLKNM